jgi:hypothetical protein
MYINMKFGVKNESSFFGVERAVVHETMKFPV